MILLLYKHFISSLLPVLLVLMDELLRTMNFACGPQIGCSNQGFLRQIRI